MADFDLLRDTARTAVLPTADQVRARGHQRTVRSRTLYGGLAALLLVGGASLAATRGGDDRATVLPGASPTASASTAPSQAALTPGITMEVRRRSAEGAARVDLEAHVTGAAPALWSKRQGRFLTEERVWQLRHKAVWGNGQESSADDPDLECRPGAPLIPVDAVVGFENPYNQKGTFTVTVSVTGCGLSEESTTEVVVSQPYVPTP